MYELTLLEVVLFAGLFLLERMKPARNFPIHKTWFAHWCLLVTFSSIWLMGLMIAWVHIPPLWIPLQNISFGKQVLIAYVTYSFVAYWYHRIRHSNHTLWHYVHYMHHAPAHMDTRITFWRHPPEMLLDSLVIIFVGKKCDQIRFMFERTCAGTVLTFIIMFCDTFLSSRKIC